MDVVAKNFEIGSEDIATILGAGESHRIMSQQLVKQHVKKRKTLSEDSLKHQNMETPEKKRKIAYEKITNLLEFTRISPFSSNFETVKRTSSLQWKLHPSGLERMKMFYTPKQQSTAVLFAVRIKVEDDSNGKFEGLVIRKTHNSSLYTVAIYKWTSKHETNISYKYLLDAKDTFSILSYFESFYNRCQKQNDLTEQSVRDRAVKLSHKYITHTNASIFGHVKNFLSQKFYLTDDLLPLKSLRYMVDSKFYTHNSGNTNLFLDDKLPNALLLVLELLEKIIASYEINYNIGKFNDNFLAECLDEIRLVKLSIKDLFWGRNPGSISALWKWIFKLFDRLRITHQQKIELKKSFYQGLNYGRHQHHENSAKTLQTPNKSLMINQALDVSNTGCQPTPSINKKNEYLANDTFNVIIKSSEQYIRTFNDAYPFFNVRPDCLKGSVLYGFINNETHGIYHYRSTMAIEMTSLIVKQTIELLQYNSLFVDCLPGQQKEHFFNDLLPSMVCVPNFRFIFNNTLVILGHLEEKLLAQIQKYTMDYKMKFIIIHPLNEADPSEDCMYVKYLIEESRKQIFKKQLTCFSTKISLGDILELDDTLSYLCFVLDEYGDDKHRDIEKEASLFDENISPFCIPRSFTAPCSEETNLEASQGLVSFRGADVVSYNDIKYNSPAYEQMLENVINCTTNLNTNEENLKFDDETIVHIVFGNAGSGKSFFVDKQKELREKGEKDQRLIIYMKAIDYATDFARMADDITSEAANEPQSMIRFLFRLCYLYNYVPNIFSHSIEESDKKREEALKMSEYIVFNGTTVSLNQNSNKIINHEKKLFIRTFKTKVKENLITLYFDGFDELAPFYKDAVKKFLKYLVNIEAIEKLILFSRIYNFEPELKKAFPTHRIHIIEYAQKDKLKILRYYLQNIYEDFNKSNVTDQKLILAVCYEFCVRLMDDLCSVPLFLKQGSTILLEIMKKHVTHQNVSLKSFENEEKEYRYKMVKHFVEQKLYILNTDKCGINDSTSYIPAQKCKTDDANKNLKYKHGVLAIFAYLNEEKRDILFKGNEKQVKVWLSEIKEGKEKMGIITKVSNGTPVFLFKIFADFFVAYWLAENIDRMKDILEDCCFSSDTTQIRDFFDRMGLEEGENLDLHRAVLSQSQDQVQQILRNNNALIYIKDRFGRTAMHLAAAYNHYLILKELLNHCSESINTQDEILKRTPLEYAIFFNSEESIEMLRNVTQN